MRLRLEGRRGETDLGNLTWAETGARGFNLDLSLILLTEVNFFEQIDRVTPGLMYGVPQVSVLGPILYLLYTSPLGDVIRRHDMNFHYYADDSQVYFSFDFVSSVTVSRIEACLQDVTAWMSLNKLKLNSKKTELLVFVPQSTPTSQILCFTAVDGSIIQPSQTARKIGVIFDHKLHMNRHVASICKSAFFFHIRTISQNRKFRSICCTKTLFHELITCRLDFCNSLLYGLPKYLVNRLQLVQNSALRLFFCNHKYDHITPLFKEVHWPPVEQRIVFKI